MTIGGAELQKRSAAENEQKEKEQMLKDAQPAKYWVDSDKFNLLMVAIIFVNSVVIGMETDIGKEYPLFFAITNDLFLFCYIAELTARLFYHGRYFFKDGFNIFDFFLVGTALFEQFFFREGGAGMFTVLRIIRLARLARMARLLRFIKELWLVVQGIGASLVTLGWVSLLLVTFCWVCAIFTSMGLGQSTVWMFTEELVPKPFEEFNNKEYFGTVGKSCFSLFQVTTLSDWSGHMMRPIILKYPQQLLFFIFFIFMTTYGMMNIVVGSLVHGAVEAARRHNQAVELMDRIRKEKLITKLDAYFTAIDTDQSQVIDRDEMERAMQRPKIIAAFQMLDMPVSSIHELMHALDKDGNGEITRHEFIEGIMRLRGESDPRETAKLILECQMIMGRVEMLERRCAMMVSKVRLLARRLDVSFEKLAEMIANWNKPGRDLSVAAGKKALPGMRQAKLILADAGDEGNSSDEDEKNRGGKGILRSLGPECNLFIRNHRKIMGRTEATVPIDMLGFMGPDGRPVTAGAPATGSQMLGITRSSRPGTAPVESLSRSRGGRFPPPDPTLLPAAPNPARTSQRRAQEVEMEQRRLERGSQEGNRQSLRDFLVLSNPAECPSRPKNAPGLNAGRRRRGADKPKPKPAPKRPSNPRSNAEELS